MSLSQLQQLESTWETEMQLGNSLSQSLAFSKAYSHYMDAMVVSEVLMENITTSLQHSLRVPAMYYTACVNLAHNYLGMQDIENAATYFLYCTYKLKMLADKPDADLLLKQTATVYWQKAVQVYTEFADKTGTPIAADMNESETYVQLQKLKNLVTLPKERMN
jgi:hypothetical protein